MIKAHELRLGNYGYAPLNEIVYITQIGHDTNPDYIGYKFVHENSSGQNGFAPIPLTEEILLKCDEIDWLLKDELGYFVLLNNKKVYIKFVHLLQNIYFCIEQKELQCDNI